jgi:type II secretory pathway pseudopilin PulG
MKGRSTLLGSSGAPGGSTPRPGGQKGFAVADILLVIVVFAILASIVVVAVRGISDRRQSLACDSDKRGLESAQDAAFVQAGRYLGEAALVTQGFLRQASSLWDVDVAGGGYTIVEAVGSPC